LISDSLLPFSYTSELIKTAIHTTYLGLVVEIVVGGELLPEYADEDIKDEDNPVTVTRYVEAPSGAEFSVRYAFDKSFSEKKEITLFIFVGGVNDSDAILRRDKIHDKKERTLDGSEVELDKKWFLQKWRYKCTSICGYHSPTVIQLYSSISADGQTSNNSVKYLSHVLSTGNIEVQLQFRAAGHRKISKPDSPPSARIVSETMPKGAAKSLQVG
jgi:hypothetical protein